MKRPEGEFFYALFSKRENITHLKKNEKKTIYDVADQLVKIKEDK